MRLMSSTSWERIFTTIRGLFHGSMFYILKFTYLYRSRGFLFLIIFFKLAYKSHFILILTPATHLSYFIHYFKKFHEKEGEMWNISFHSFRHFYEILILNYVSALIYTKLDKKPLMFHQKTATLSEMTWNVKCEKGALWNAPDILYTLFAFSYFAIVTRHFMISV